MEKEIKGFASQIARQLYAMASKKKATDLAENLRNERYQRTFTDEYLFRRKPRARESVPPEIREGWKKLAGPL